ncbi:MAG TPA: hypothetical protein VJ546_01195 [Bacillales bacterium]|nr:hypothetical protein [Bacillales bacterium]
MFLIADLGSFIANPTVGAAAWILIDVLSYTDFTGILSSAAHGPKGVPKAKAVLKAIKGSRISIKIFAKGTGKLAFSGGKAGEKYLANLVGGKSQVYFKTSSGGRYIDQLANGIAYESKVGYTSLTSRVRTQILKDAELIKKGQINGAEWNFFRSADTGKIGASKQLLQFLKQNGIKYKIH